MNSSKELTLGNSSRDGGVQVPNFSKPFDEDELTRALTRTLISGRI